MRLPSFQTILRSCRHRGGVRARARCPRFGAARWFAPFLTLCVCSAASAGDCRAPGVHVQVLGSGGPELDDRRASSGYLVWHDGKARVLIDLGPGSLLQFEQQGALIEDIDIVLLSHLHVDHSADLPALIKASYFSDRAADLPVFGPSGNSRMPDTGTFVRALFDGHEGAFRYLGDYLDGSAAYRVLPIDVEASGRTQHTAWQRDGVTATAVPVHHGPIPALAWRVTVEDRVMVFSGDMNGDNGTLAGLAMGADLLVAHHAIPEDAVGAARNLHMPPSVIGEIAARAGVKQVVMSHRMRRTLGREAESSEIVRRTYSGALAFADDGQCFDP